MDCDRFYCLSILRVYEVFHIRFFYSLFDSLIRLVLSLPGMKAV